eukprot:scaffold1761_cov78-Skeletonema_dohrnii-CCMP3373.AAC.11
MKQQQPSLYIASYTTATAYVLTMSCCSEECGDRGSYTLARVIVILVKRRVLIENPEFEVNHYLCNIVEEMDG